jgi:hypothetical protein
VTKDMRVQERVSNYLLIAIILQIPIVINSIGSVPYYGFEDVVAFSILILTAYEFYKARRKKLLDRKFGIAILIIYFIYNIYLAINPLIGIDGTNVNFINEYPYVFLIEDLFGLDKPYPYLAMFRSFAIVIIFISMFDNIKLIKEIR